jgi:hypothetical protein
MDLASRRPLLRCDYTEPLYTLRLPTSVAHTLCPLLSPRLLLLGTAGLVTPVATLWLSSVTVPLFLALGRLMSISAMRASWVVMFDFLFLPSLRVRRMPLILFTVICGLLQFLVFLAASTI